VAGNLGSNLTNSIAYSRCDASYYSSAKNVPSINRRVHRAAREARADGSPETVSCPSISSCALRVSGARTRPPWKSIVKIRIRAVCFNRALLKKTKPCKGAGSRPFAKDAPGRVFPFLLEVSVNQMSKNSTLSQDTSQQSRNLSVYKKH